MYVCIGWTTFKSCLFLLFESQGQNAGCQTWWQVLYPLMHCTCPHLTLLELLQSSICPFEKLWCHSLCIWCWGLYTRHEHILGKCSTPEINHPFGVCARYHFSLDNIFKKAKQNFKILCVNVPSCLYVHHVRVPDEARKGRWIPWNWSY